MQAFQWWALAFLFTRGRREDEKNQQNKKKIHQRGSLGKKDKDVRDLYGAIVQLHLPGTFFHVVHQLQVVALTAC